MTRLHNLDLDLGLVRQEAESSSAIADYIAQPRFPSQPGHRSRARATAEATLRIHHNFKFNSTIIHIKDHRRCCDCYLLSSPSHQSSLPPRSAYNDEIRHLTIRSRIVAPLTVATIKNTTYHAPKRATHSLKSSPGSHTTVVGLLDVLQLITSAMLRLDLGTT